MALRQEDGSIHLVRLEKGVRKVRGLGVIDALETLADVAFGDTVNLGTRRLVVLPPRLPEMVAGMKRRAQTISAKDAGFFITRLGIGEGDVVLEAGLGSGGLAMHVLRVLGSTGRLISVENRQEHAEVGLANIRDASTAWGSSVSHSCILGEISSAVAELDCSLDAALLDLADHAVAIAAVAPHLKSGARLGCYCPVSSQLETAWQAAEEAGLTIDWAGELMERRWGRASKGGMRPVNGPFGHTAFLLIALKV